MLRHMTTMLAAALLLAPIAFGGAPAGSLAVAARVCFTLLVTAAIMLAMLALVWTRKWVIREPPARYRPRPASHGQRWEMSAGLPMK